MKNADLKLSVSAKGAPEHRHVWYNIKATSDDGKVPLGWNPEGANDTDAIGELLQKTSSSKDSGFWQFKLPPYAGAGWYRSDDFAEGDLDKCLIALKSALAARGYKLAVRI